MRFFDRSVEFTRGSIVLRYTVGVVATLAALGLRLGLDPLLRNHGPSLPFVMAVILATYMGGRGPGVFATVMSTLAVDWFFVEPRDSFAIKDLDAMAALGLFCLVGICISFMGGRLRVSPPGKPGAASDRTASGDSEVPAWRLRDWRQRQHIVWFGTAIVILVIEAGLFFGAWSRFANREQWSIHTYQALQKIDALFSTLKDANTASAGFILTGQDTFLKPYRDAVDRIQIQFEDLRASTADNPRQQSHLRDIQTVLDQKLADTQQSIEWRKMHGPAAPIDFARIDQGKDLMDRARIVFDSMTAEEQALLRQREASAEAAARGMGFLMVLGAGVLVTLLMAGSRAIDRGITERKRAEEELRRAEEERKLMEGTRAERQRFLDVLETLPAMVCLLTPDYHVAWANRSFREKFGDSEGRPCYEYCFGRTEPCEFCESYEVLKTGKPHRWEVNGPDGSVIEACDVPFTDVDGSPLILEMDIDITEHRRAESELSRHRHHLEELVEERTNQLRMANVQLQAEISVRKQTEAALRRSEADLQDAQRIAHLGRWTWEVAPDIITWSEEIYHIFGRDPKLPAPSVAESAQLFTGTSWARLREGLQQAHKCGTPYELDLEAVRADGTRAWIIGRGEAVRDSNGVVVRVRGTVQDITERKQAEIESRAREQRLRLATDAAQLGIFEWTVPTDTAVWENQRMYEIFGIPETTDPLNRDRFVRETVHAEDLPRFERELEESMQPGALFRGAYRIRRVNDGQWHWIQYFGKFELTADGKPLRLLGVLQDITERKQAEAKLRETTRRFQTIVDHAPMAIYVKNRDGRFVFGNRQLEQYTGHPLERLLGMTDYDFAPKEDADRWRENDLKVLEGQPAEFEETGTDRDGRPYVNISVKFPLFDESGTPVEVCGISSDITERKRAEEALRTQADLLRLSFDAIIVWRLDGTIETWNTGAEKLYGFSEKEAVGRVIHDLLPSVFPKPWPEIRTELVEKGFWEGELRHRTREGREVIVSARKQLIRNGIERVLETNRDITEHKSAEEAVRASEERLRLAQEAAQLGTYEWRPATGALFWDERMRELWGVGPEEPVSYALFMSRLHPEDRASTQASVDQALDSNGTGQYHSELRVVHPSRTIWIAATGQATFENGQAVRLVGTVQDITERKAFQEELQRLVSERTAKLKEMVGELEHFSYTITHDMRAPLRGLHGFAGLMAEECQGCERRDATDFLRRIQTSALRMDALITDSLNYSRAVRQELPLGPVDLGALLRGMLDSYPEVQAEKAQIEIAGELPLVMGNEAALTQVLSNLLANAIKFAKPGQKPEIRVWAELCAKAEAGDVEGERVRLWVEDNGIGIPDSMKPKLFDLFSRGHRTYEGTGLGLALVRKVVDHMGGKVGVESEEGRGSRFWVELRPGNLSMKAA